MNKLYFLILYCILNLLLCNSLKCGEQQIENCLQCGTGDLSNTCIQCEDNFFPILNNLHCIACDDPLYGQVGCGGNCDATNFKNDRFVMCNKNDCREGFYNLYGFCFSCEEGFPFCKKCSVNLNEYNEEEYKCDECLNDEYLLDEYGECIPCSMENCIKCHYTKDSDTYGTECDECEYGFFLNSKKECQKCNGNVYFPNGYCNTCLDQLGNYDPSQCHCYNYYTKNNNSTCVECPENCPYCEFNNQTNKTECKYCESGYVLNSEKTCTFCGEGCENCFLSDDLSPICTNCYSGKIGFLSQCSIVPENCRTWKFINDDQIECIECYSQYTLKNGICVSCPNNCYSCKTTENNETECLECHYEYALNSKKECDYCSNIEQEGMNGCQRCGFNKSTNKYDCYECYQTQRDDSYEYYYPYAYVINTFQCFNNLDPDNPPFFGCLKSYYNESSGKYECQTCNNYRYKDEFILVVDEKICKKSDDMNLQNCYEAKNIGTDEDPLYSCIKCFENTTKIIDKNNRIDCFERKNQNLSYCLEGEIDENNVLRCTKCISNSEFNSNNICECNYGFFGKYEELCYKCDDINYGNPGCNAEKGCDYYYSNDQLNCKECKDGYFNYTQGQCYSCSSEIRNCGKCHYDDSIYQLICDKCSDGYMYNSNEKTCDLKKCEEYPEICKGCIICEEKSEEYISNGKCQKCKTGFFKTRDEQCVPCKAEENGGPSCYKCKYAVNENGEETNNIICDICPDYDHFLSSDGKCYNIQNLESICDEFGFIKNADNTEKLACILCKPGYYLNSEGQCINYLNYLEKISKCSKYSYIINNITFCAQNDCCDENNNYYHSAYYCDLYQYYEYSYYFEEYYYYYYSLKDYKKYFNNNIIIPEINHSFKGKCIECEDGYFLNKEGNCVKLNCSLISLFGNVGEKFLKCRSFCYSYDNIFIEITYNKKIYDENNIEKISTVTIDLLDFFDALYYEYDYNYNEEKYKEIYKDYYEYIKPIFDNVNLCYTRAEDSNEFENCERVQYDQTTNTYKCSKCPENYILDTQSNSCKYQFEGYNCVIENIGTNSSPIYSCKECFDYYNQILISTDNNIKYCINKENGNEYCSEASADTTYANTVYNCTNCSLNFFPFYSKFYGRIICQNIFGSIITKKELDLEKYEYLESSKAIDGKCETNNLFTPDGENCYECDNNYVGMHGCKGACSFSLERNDVLKCEEGCKTGYIEVSEGVCETCEGINNGCSECHYENVEQENYIGYKRKRKYVCDKCDSGFIKKEGKCFTCYDLGLDDCDECEIAPQNNNKYIYTKCHSNAVLEDGKCFWCDYDYKFIKDNKCFSCSDYENGGIKGCDKCGRNSNDELKCYRCLEGFIFLTNNNTCLNISENKKLEKYNSCELLSLDNNQFYCSRCKIQYSLLKENDNDKGKCTKTSILYDYDIEYDHYYSNAFDHSFYDETKSTWIYFYDDEFYYYSNYINYPCQESINLGTKEKPIYSCTKCYENYDDYFYYYSYDYIRIINKRNNMTNCIYRYKANDYLYDCFEAFKSIKDGVEKYDCIKCYYNYKLIYDPENDIHYCHEGDIDFNEQKCLVIDCKRCISGNNYFCEECLSNYEVNSLTGSCVEKSEVVPAITFKDIFRLEMNSNKVINGETIYGPSLRLRGITSSEINTRHAFLIYLTFKIKSSRNRNLEEEEKTIPAICEAINSVEESQNDVNIIDYECIGKASEDEDFSHYQLDSISEGENNGLLKNSNLNKISSEMKKEDFEREEPSFTFEELSKYVTFEINEIQKIKSKNYIFDFKIEGKINKEISRKAINTELELNEIEENAICTFNIEENKKANLYCNMDVNKYKEQNLFTFKTHEINTDDNDFYLAKIDEIELINDEDAKEEKKEGEEEEKKEGEEEKKKKNNYIVIIIIGGTCLLAFIVITVLIIICVIKCKKKKSVGEKTHEGQNVVRFENINCPSNEAVNN